MPKRLTLEEFTNRASIIHNNKYDYSLVVYKNTETKVTLICSIHGKFIQTPHSHLTGNGCPKCSGKEQGTKESFIEKAVKVHNKLYNYDKVVYKDSQTKVIITCPIHGDFEQTPAMHVSGRGCKRCASVTCTEDFIYKSNIVHNNKYDYSKSVYINFKTPIEIICKEHGSFFQRPTDHTNNRGCPYCAKTGYDCSKPGILYYVSIDNGFAYKIGITNKTVETRFTAKELERISILRTWKFDDGQEAYNMEQKILKEFYDSRYTGDNLLLNGNTELFNRDVLNLDTTLEVFSK